MAARKKKITFDLVATLVQALKDGKETLEQLEYTLSKDKPLFEKVRNEYLHPEVQHTAVAPKIVW